MLIDNIPKTIFRYENIFKSRLGTKIWLTFTRKPLHIETDLNGCALEQQELSRLNSVVFQFQYVIYGPPWFWRWQGSLWGLGNASSQSSSLEVDSFHVKSCLGLFQEQSWLAEQKQEQRARRDLVILASQGCSLLQPQFPQWHAAADLEKDCSRLESPWILHWRFRPG